MSQDYFWVEPNDTLEAYMDFIYTLEPKSGGKIVLDISKESSHLGQARIDENVLTFVPAQDSSYFDTIVVDVFESTNVTIGGGFDSLGNPLPGDSFFALNLLEQRKVIVNVSDDGFYKNVTIKKINDCENLAEVEIEFFTPTHRYIYYELGEVSYSGDRLWHLDVEELQSLITVFVYIPDYYLKKEVHSFVIQRPVGYDSLFVSSFIDLDNTLEINDEKFSFTGAKTPVGCMTFERNNCDTMMVIVTNYKGCPSYTEVNFDTLIHEKDHWKYVSSSYKWDSGILCFHENLRPHNDTLYIPNMRFGDSLVYVKESYKYEIPNPIIVDTVYNKPEDTLITILPVLETSPPGVLLPFIFTVRSDTNYKYQGEIIYTGKNDAIDCRTILNQENVRVEAIELYPNPTSSTLNLTRKVDVIDVFDITGQYILSAKQVKSIDVSALAAGMYIVRILNEGEFITLKFKKL